VGPLEWGFGAQIWGGVAASGGYENLIECGRRGGDEDLGGWGGGGLRGCHCGQWDGSSSWPFCRTTGGTVRRYAKWHSLRCCLRLSL
jgi:hypothetical protein